MSDNDFHYIRDPKSMCLPFMAHTLADTPFSYKATTVATKACVKLSHPRTSPNLGIEI